MSDLPVTFKAIATVGVIALNAFGAWVNDANFYRIHRFPWSIFTGLPDRDEDFELKALRGHCASWVEVGFLIGGIWCESFALIVAGFIVSYPAAYFLAPAVRELQLDIERRLREGRMNPHFRGIEIVAEAPHPETGRKAMLVVESGANLGLYIVKPGKSYFDTSRASALSHVSAEGEAPRIVWTAPDRLTLFCACKATSDAEGVCATTRLADRVEVQLAVKP